MATVEHRIRIGIQQGRHALRRRIAELEAGAGDLGDVRRRADEERRRRLRARAGDPLLALSARALACLSADQRASLERVVRLVSADVGTIEDCSGGSVRCMLAEVHLPRR